MQTSDIHAERMKYAMERLQTYFPIINSKILDNLSSDEIMLFELYTSRFTKLQDLMGGKIFALLLESLGEFDDTMTFVDKLNRLEKIGVIESAAEWRLMRGTRHHLSHEYQDHPGKMAGHLNEAYKLGYKLLECLARVHSMQKSL